MQAGPVKLSHFANRKIYTCCAQSSNYWGTQLKSPVVNHLQMKMQSHAKDLPAAAATVRAAGLRKINPTRANADSQAKIVAPSLWVRKSLMGKIKTVVLKPNIPVVIQVVIPVEILVEIDRRKVIMVVVQAIHPGNQDAVAQKAGQLRLKSVFAHGCSRRCLGLRECGAMHRSLFAT